MERKAQARHGQHSSFVPQTNIFTYLRLVEDTQKGFCFFAYAFETKSGGLNEKYLPQTQHLSIWLPVWWHPAKGSKSLEEGSE